MTIRKAWELLSLLDQIHLWGVTDFRSSIIQCLKQWHEFSRMCYANDVRFLIRVLKKDRFTHDGKEYLLLPGASLQLADWTKHVTDEAREKLQKRAIFHFRESFRRDFPALSHSWPKSVTCLLDDCGPEGNPGYLLLSKEEMAEHYREIHGQNDEQIASLEHRWDMEESVNGSSNNTLRIHEIHQLQKRKRERPGSGEHGSCTKRFKSLTFEDIGDIHDTCFIDLTEN